MNENKKFNYTAPAVKVVAFQVEQGFAGSGPLSVGSYTTTTNTTSTPPTIEVQVQEQGTEGFFTRAL